MKKIILTGATGLIGKSLVKKLIDNFYEVIIVTRDVHKTKKVYQNIDCIFSWQNFSAKIQTIENVEAVINLAGENIFKSRWSKNNKKNFYDSRINSTRNLIDAIIKMKFPPKIFLSASAIGYYDNNIDGIYSESSLKGSSFLSDLTSAWEIEQELVSSQGILQASIRTGIVLSRDGGALKRMLFPFKIYLGGPLGSGNQWFPWIHIDDLVDLYIFVLDKKLSGKFNAVSSKSCTMNEFSYLLGKVLKKPSYLKIPKCILKIILGEGADYLVNGSRVLPKRTLEKGFIFKYSKLDSALQNLLN